MQPIFNLKTVYSPITIHCDNDENDCSESKQIRQVFDSGLFLRIILTKSWEFKTTQRNHLLEDTSTVPSQT